MTFERPLLFLALPILALWIGWLEWRLPAPAWRRVLRFGTRMGVLAALVAALAGPYHTSDESLPPRLAIALDRATRLSEDAWREGEALADRVEAAAQDAGIETVRIGFTTRAAAPGQEPPPSPKSATATGLAGARLALGGAETGGIYVVTDGRGDLRGVRAAVGQMRRDGIQVTAGAVPTSVPPPVVQPALGSVDMPPSARGPFVVRAAVETLGPHASGRVTLHVDGKAVQERTVDGKGAELAFDELELEPGLHEVAVTLEIPDGDAVRAVDHARGIVDVRAPPRVTVLLRNAGSSPWRRALVGQRLQVSEATPESLGGILSSVDLLPDLVVADAASLVALPPAATVMLARQVQGGLGLVVSAGGQDEAWATLAAGPIGDLLPVTPIPAPEPPPPPPPPPTKEPEPDIEPPKPDDDRPGLKAERRPEKALPISLLLVIDRSPSMEGAKFEMALEGARRAALALSRWDRIGVITFARDPTLDVPFRSARHAKTRLPMWLSRVRTGGETTNIVRALQLAYRTFAKEKTPIRHLLLLTDGRQYPPGPIFGPIVKKMRALGVTITAVGIGSGASMRDLRDIVQWAAAGMVVPVMNEADLPTILTEDTKRLARDRLEQAEKIEARLRPEDQEPEAQEPEVDDVPEPPPPTREPETEPTPPPDVPDGPGEGERLPVRIVRQHEALAGMRANDLPSIGMPHRSELRPGAALLLEREDGLPVLAAVRGGLGRVLAWTPTPDDRGALAWPKLGALFGQVARSAMAPRGALGYLPTAHVTQGPDGAFLRVDWPAGTSSGRLEARWIGPEGNPQDLGVFTPEDTAGRALPAAAPDALCRIEMSIPGAPDLPPLSYAVRRVRRDVETVADVQALERVLEAPLDTPEAFVASLRGRTLPTRLPRWPWFLWIALALLPLDVWLHRRSRTA